MKTNKPKRPGNRGGHRRSGDAVKIIALLVFIAVGVSVVGGTIWYYAFFQPRAAESITSATSSFTQDFFNVTHTDITGQEGTKWMTETLAEETTSSDRARVWKERDLVSRITGDVQVQFLHQGLNTASTRATFWHYEELEGEEGREFLVYYDYDFVYAGGNWLISAVRTASQEGLVNLRKARGVYDQHYPDEDEEDVDQDEDAEEEEDQDTEEDTEDGGSE